MGDAPPRQARASLYSYMSRLRTALDGTPIVRRSGGYVLETDPASIDLHRFPSLVALGRYSRLRDRLADELGLDPGPALRDLHASLIQRPQWSPRQLPAAPTDFTGMKAELAALDLAGPIVTITGPAGAGKTRLALHWAHEHASDYPDGQLFVDLNSSDPADVVREFITALGTSPDGIPPEPHAQTALYRTLLADRRMLIVLDNAADTAQVVPLLPGTPRCRVVVTSRERLPGLVTAHGARPAML